MAAKKNYYYILVMTDNGPVFVTGIKPHHYAEYDRQKKPMLFDKARAEDITQGLNLNFNLSFMVTSKWEIDTQPYNYEDYNIEFVKKEKENNK